MLVPGRMDDPDLTGVRVTRAEVTQDLSSAKVYYVAPDDAVDAAVHAALERAQGYLRGQLAGLGLRRVPRLVFARDRSFEEGQRVLDILAHLEHVPLDDDPPAGAAGSEPGEGGGAPAGDGDHGGGARASGDG